MVVTDGRRLLISNGPIDPAGGKVNLLPLVATILGRVSVGGKVRCGLNGIAGKSQQPPAVGCYGFGGLLRFWSVPTISMGCYDGC
jgi:hypothetical protein